MHSNDNHLFNSRYACLGEGSTVADGATTDRGVAHEQCPEGSSQRRHFHKDLELWGHEAAPCWESSEAHRNLSYQRKDCLQKVLQGSQAGRPTGHLLWTYEDGLRQRAGVILVRRGIPWPLPAPPSHFTRHGSLHSGSGCNFSSLIYINLDLPRAIFSR